MQISIVLPDGKKNLIDLAKSSNVEELRDRVVQLCPDIPDENLRLWNKGKLLEDRTADGKHAKLYNNYDFKDFETVTVQNKPQPAERGLDQEDELPAPPTQPAEIAVEQPEAEESEIPMEDDTPVPCEQCNDIPGKCSLCGCVVCEKNTDMNKLVLCDGYEEDGLCNAAYHIYCLTPKLDAVPDDTEWFCPDCSKKAKKRRKATVMPGQGAAQARKKALAPSAKTNRKWGGGVSCASVDNRRQDISTNIEGPIPGVEVGQSWEYRIGVSAERVHCPPVAGMASNAKTKRAVSIVVSGGYEDDKDQGDELTYTGEGGRELKEGNKRTSEQNKDQTLTRNNLGLARSCFGFGQIKENSNKGGDAGNNWEKSGPVRVIRGSSKNKSRRTKPKHSQYEPEQGFRYDGIYKVVRFYPEVGKSGFRVWQFVLRRDDDAPAPWTEEGKARIEELGLEMVLSEKTKRKREGSSEEENTTPPKKAKVVFTENALKLMEADTVNQCWWEEVRVAEKGGMRAVVDKIDEVLRCPICMEMDSFIKCPVTLSSCKHNFCGGCLKRAMKHDESFQHSCPTCRNTFESDDALKVNEELKAALEAVIKPM